ncbi:MAG: hypothetical protein AAFQ92_07870, partial [Bacteroidota bacterium]
CVRLWLVGSRNTSVGTIFPSLHVFFEQLTVPYSTTMDRRASYQEWKLEKGRLYLQMCYGFPQAKA